MDSLGLGALIMAFPGGWAMMDSHGGGALIMCPPGGWTLMGEGGLGGALIMRLLRLDFQHATLIMRLPWKELHH